jgi:hypothetical protein
MVGEWDEKGVPMLDRFRETRQMRRCGSDHILGVGAVIEKS